MTATEPKTSRGKESRERILGAAADLFHRHGVHGTSIDQVLEASGTGKSQFYHYFQGKDELVRGVLGYQAQRIFEQQAPYLERLDSFDGIASWFADLLAFHEESRLVGGCPIGTLAAEMADRDGELAREIDAVFDGWRSRLATGLRRMRERGDLREDADPEALAAFVVAVHQGAILLARTSKDIEPLRAALDHALRYLRSQGTEEMDGQKGLPPSPPRSAWASWMS